jgi:ADP-ribose pyrophosphatase YjhB (NUDIX family)
MKPITTLNDSDVFPHKQAAAVETWSERRTVKIVLQNERGEIALVTNPVHNCHLLPGGEIEDGESVHQAADRECREEANRSIKQPVDIGIVEEFRARDGKHYITSGVAALADTPTEEDTRTGNEKDLGLKVNWYPLDDVLKIFADQNRRLAEGKIEFYNTGFNIVRDKAIVDEAVKRGLIK